MKKANHLFFLLSAAALMLAGCAQEDTGIDTTYYGPLKVLKCYQHNIKSTEKELTEARLGTMIRLEGENFMGIKAITCNGSPASLNPNLRTETSIIFRIPTTNADTNEDTPTGEDAGEYCDKIIITSTGNEDYVYDFHIMGSSPSISGMDHTLPSIGSWVTVTGSSLKGVKKVVLYDDNNQAVAETEEIRNEASNGKSFQFKMPEVVLWSELDESTSGNFETCYEGGYIVAETDNGDAASPNYFYRQKNIFLNNFYSQSDAAWGIDLYTYNASATNSSYYAWGSGTSGNLPDSETYPAYDEDIAKAQLSDGPQAPYMFRALPEYGTKIPAISLSDGEHSADGGACIARACFNSAACAGRALGMAQNLSCGVELFSAATGTDKLAFQFDYYIPAAWNSGRIAVTFVDNGVNWMAHFHPWTTHPDHYAKGMEHWETATIPLTSFSNFMDQTYSYILKNTIKGVNGDYACQGMIAFYNDDCDGYSAREIAAEEHFVVYWNNLRIVPMTTLDLSEDED